MDMRFKPWNIRNLYRAGSQVTASRELTTYTLDLLGVKEVKWEGCDTVLAGEYIFFYGHEKEND
jgi:hypothetical protein